MKNKLRSVGFEKYGEEVCHPYHNLGHNMISRDCKNGPWDGVLSSSTMAARDPIFWRWHSHLENLIQEYRDKRSRK